MKIKSIIRPRREDYISVNFPYELEVKVIDHTGIPTAEIFKHTVSPEEKGFEISLTGGAGFSSLIRFIGKLSELIELKMEILIALRDKLWEFEKIFSELRKPVTAVYYWNGENFESLEVEVEDENDEEVEDE